MKQDLYYRKNKLDHALERLKQSKDVPDENKIAILDFYNQSFAEGLSTARLQKYIYSLMKISMWLGKKFEDAKREDIIKVVQKIESNEKYSDWTKYGYKVIIKKFYKWLRNSEDVYPEEVRWIKPRIKNGTKLPEELLNEEDIMKMVDTADRLRDKALIFVLYESGCRVGEIATLSLKNVQFNDHGATMIVSGKTGDRRVLLVSSAPYLSTWIANHPDKDNSDAPLWAAFKKKGDKSKLEFLSYHGIALMLKRTAAKAGINKKVHAHLFRHSRATHLAKHLTEAQMKQFFGWTQGSDMASVYVHLSGRDVDNSILKLNGIGIDEEKEESKLKPKKCPRCRLVNSATARFCQQCSAALDLKVALELEDEIRRRTDEAAMNFNAVLSNVKDDDARKLLFEIMKPSGLSKKDVNKLVGIMKPLIKAGVIK